MVERSSTSGALYHLDMDRYGGGHHRQISLVDRARRWTDGGQMVPGADIVSVGRRAADLPGQAEVRDLDEVRGGTQDVLRLQVAVEEAVPGEKSHSSLLHNDQ